MVYDANALKIIEACKNATRDDCIKVITALYEAIENSDYYYIRDMNREARKALKIAD